MKKLELGFYSLIMDKELETIFPVVSEFKEYLGVSESKDILVLEPDEDCEDPNFEELDLSLDASINSDEHTYWKGQVLNGEDEPINYVVVDLEYNLVMCINKNTVNIDEYEVLYQDNMEECDPF